MVMSTVRIAELKSRLPLRMRVDVVELLLEERQGHR
jgi:hypothetical protein